MWIALRNTDVHFFTGLVSKQESEMAKNGKMLGQEHDNGGIRPLWCNGEAFASASGNHPQERQRERMCGTLAVR